MQPLHAAYHHIHCALGGEMEKLEGHAIALDATSPAELAGFGAHVGMIDGILEAHAHEEEVVLWPEIESRLPGMMDSYEIDHREERSLFARIHADVAALGQSGADREATQRRLVRSIAVATEQLKLHMAKEEEHVYEPFAATLTDEEWKSLGDRILSGLPPEMLPTAMPWLASYLTAAEVAESFSLYADALGPQRVKPFVAPLPNGMPPEKWQEVLSYAPKLAEYAR